MKVTTECNNCKQDFLYDPSQESHLVTDNNSPVDLMEYPIQDEVWPSRRWNVEHTEYIDLSGPVVVCQDCYGKQDEQ
jgi:hypothetical protein